MTWLSWRQHRGELIGAAVILAVLGIVLLLHGVPMHEAHQRDGISACQLQASGGDTESCAQAVLSFEGRWAGLPNQFAAWLPFLPMAAGMLVGVPLLAREFEQGTWQLVWTQGVTRRRWLASKLAVVLGGVYAMSVLFAVGMSWWLEPLAPHPFTIAKFNHAVLVFPAYIVAAVAIGILAGAAARRTVVAAAITVGAYLAVRLPVEFYLRPRYREPLTTDDPSVAAGGLLLTDGAAGAAAPGSINRGDSFTYQPADRFWEFQIIETMLLVAVTVVLLAIAWRIVLGPSRRPSAG